MANESPHRHFGPTCCVPWAISLFVHILFNLQYNLNANLRRAIETHVKIINKFAEMKCVERDLCNAKNRTIRDRWEEIKSIWRKNGAKLSLKSKWMCVNTSNRMKCELKLKIDGRMELPKNRNHKRTHATHHSEQLILRSAHTHNGYCVCKRITQNTGKMDTKKWKVKMMRSDCRKSQQITNKISQMTSTI